MDMSRGVINGGWESFEAKRVHPEASERQRDGMRTAFYAGATVVALALERLGEKDISEEQGVSIFHMILMECKAYREGLEK